jgi:flagellar basal-body rod modification protein FlgD
MSTGSTNPTNSTTNGSTSSASTGGANSLNSLSANDFLQLMITELQNQDPLDPTDESEIMQQTAALSEITSSTQLTSTLDSMQISSNLTGAAGLIGANITGLDGNGNAVSGVVSSVTVSGGTATLQVGNDAVPLDNSG